ncbi:MAG: hydroxymethylbilane synthase [Bacteroidetes bacterium]|nr:hydroxymethylbilane synthase [Bacteroidota bacterium]
MSKTLVVGTRGSELALWQAHFLQQQLSGQGVATELRIIRTHGDRVQDRSFAQLSGTGFFTAELEHALQQREIDVAVHSHKDLPTQMPADLVIGAVSYRADPSDWLLIHPQAIDRREMLDLKPGARVGTSSVRRQSQLLAMRPDLGMVPVRGNVPTRLQKVLDGELDAVVLAGAGLERLGLPLQGLEVHKLNPRDYPPAPAQGVLAFQARKDDAETLAVLAKINDFHSAFLIRAERQVLANLRGGCQLPLGAYAEEKDGISYLSLSLGSADGRFPRRLRLEHPDPDVLVVEAWRKLHAPAPGSIFISRDLAPDSVLARACADHAISVHAQSLLDFEPVPGPWPADGQWLMFSSRTAAGLFASQDQRLFAHCRFGAIGEGTARALRRLGVPVAVTLDPQDLDQSCRDFAEKAAGQTVVFPQAENSLRSIQERLAGQVNVVDWVVYRNSPKKDVVVPDVQLAILTSPMNARNYLEHYPERKSKRMIAIGESTAKALRQAGAFHIFEARRPSDLALVEAVFSA